MRAMFYLVGKNSGKNSASLWDTVPKRQQGEPGYMGVFATKTSSQNTQRLLWIKENQISQVKEFSTLLCTGRCKSLDSLKSFLWCAPYLCRANTLCFLILSFLRVYRWGLTTVSDDLMAGNIMFLSRVPSGLTIRAALTWWLDCCNIFCLLIWQAIFFIHIHKEKNYYYN